MEPQHTTFTDPPVFTPTFNSFLDYWTPRLHPDLFKIVMLIVRATFGGNREKAKLSISQIEKGTGLSRQTVIRQVNEGLKIDLLERDEIFGTLSYTYSLGRERNFDTEDQ